MNVLKKFLCFLASIGFCAGLGCFVLHKTADSIVTETVVSEVVDEMSNAALNQVNQLTSFLPDELQEEVNKQLIDQLPQDTKQKVEEIKDVIAQDPQLAELSETYLNAIITNAIDGSSQLPDMNKDVAQLAQDYVPELAQAAGVSISEEQVESLTGALSESIDFNSVMEKAVEKLNTSLSTPQKKMLSLIQAFQVDSLLWISLGMMVSMLIMIILCTMHPIKWLLYAASCSLVCGFALMIGSKLMAMLMKGKLLQLGTIFASVGMGVFDSLFQYGVIISGMAIAGLLAYALINFLKNHLVYE